MFRSYDHLQAEIYILQINININININFHCIYLHLKIAVRPKHVADNLKKTVNNY
jgi:hypothetical protein